MSASPQEFPHYYTLEEYFALMNVSDRVYEYRDGEIVCVSGGSREHGLIGSNAQTELTLKIDRNCCSAFSADQAIKAPTIAPFCFPDLSIVCGNPSFLNIRGFGVIDNPIVLIEIISGNGQYERIEKKAAYLSTPTLRDYIIIEQKRPFIEHYTRLGINEWRLKVIDRMEDHIEISSIKCKLSLTEIYAGINF